MLPALDASAMHLGAPFSCDKITALRLGGVQIGMICDAIEQAAAGEPHIEALALACRIGFGALSTTRRLPMSASV